MHTSPAIAVLPTAPKNGSPVPWLTSLFHKQARGNYGSAAYPGNCSGELIKDLLRFFRPKRVLDPMTGSGTCADVCRELGIECVSFDIREGRDACDARTYAALGSFDFVWLHPPYWRMKRYTSDPRDLSNAPTLEAFLDGMTKLIGNCASVLETNGKLAVLMGDIAGKDGFVPLTYQTKRLCLAAGLRQACTDVIHFQHNASSSAKTYPGSFIPLLHEVCAFFEKEAHQCYSSPASR